MPVEALQVHPPRPEGEIMGQRFVATTRRLRMQPGDNAKLSLKELTNFAESTPDIYQTLLGDIREQFPYYPENKAKLMAKLALLPFHPDPDPADLITKSENVSTPDKRASGAMQHMLAHYLVSATYNDATSEHINTAFEIMETFYHIADHANAVTRGNLRGWIAGMRTEAAFMKVIDDLNYETGWVSTLSDPEKKRLQSTLGRMGSSLGRQDWVVFLPDYNYIPHKYTKLEGGDEVLQLDVLNGIDLLLVFPEGEVGLLDMKGRSNITPLTMYDPAGTEKYLYNARYTNPKVSRVIDEVVKDTAMDDAEKDVKNRRVARTKFFLPTVGCWERETLGNVQTVDIEERKKQLTQWLTFRDRNTNTGRSWQLEIIDKLELIFAHYNTLRGVTQLQGR